MHKLTCRYIRNISRPNIPIANKLEVPQSEEFDLSVFEANIIPKYKTQIIEDEGNRRMQIGINPYKPLDLCNFRVYLFNYLWACSLNATLILKVNDLEKEEQEISDESKQTLKETLKDLEWLGIQWGEGAKIEQQFNDIGILPINNYYVSNRQKIYAKWVNTLMQNKDAFYCYCTESNGVGPTNQWKCTSNCKLKAEQRSTSIPPLIRLSPNIEGLTAYTDPVQGEISIQNSKLGEPILMHRGSRPTSLFVDIIDSIIDKITHIFRGDGILSGLKHIMLDIQRPVYATLGSIRDIKGSKLIGTKNNYEISRLKELGLISDSIYNGTALLGWKQPGHDYSMKQLMEYSMYNEDEILRPSLIKQAFDIKHVKKEPVNLDLSKFFFINKHMLVNKFEYVNNSEAKEKCNLFREIFVEQLPQFKTEIYRCSEINMQLIMDTLTKFIKTEKELKKFSYFFYEPDLSSFIFWVL